MGLLQHSLTRLVIACVLLCVLTASQEAAQPEVDHVVEVTVSAQGELDIERPRSLPEPSTRPSYISIADGDTQHSQQPMPAANPDEEVVCREKQQAPQVQTGAANHAKSALIKELEALELMIKLQEKKIALLEKIRSKTLIEHDAPISTASSAHSLSNPQVNERFADLIERKIEAVTASTAEELMSHSQSFDALFVAKAVIPIPQQHTLVDMKMMKLRPGGHQELLVLAFSSGAIEFYLPPSSSPLLRISLSKDGFVIRAMELDLHSDSPSLAVIFEQPQAVIYTLELTENGRHLMGNHADNATLINTATMFTSVPGSKFRLDVAELSKIQLTSAPNAMAITRTARRSVLSIGGDDGSLQFFTLNGTLLHTIATNATIRTMVTQRNLVALNNGSSTVLLPLARGREASFVICEGTTAQVTSIAFDSLHSDVVYAGTNHGEVLVFSTRDSSGSGSIESPAGACKMVARVLLREYQTTAGRQHRQHMNTQVYALKGFVIASTGSSRALYNVSRAQDEVVGMTLVCSLPAIVNSEGDRSLSRPLAISEGSYVTNMVFAVNQMTGGDGFEEVMVFQSLLVSRIEKSDTSWVGALYIGIVITVVLVSQFCFRRPQSAQLPSDFDPWGIQQNRKEPVSGGTHPRSSLFGGEDTGVSQREVADLAHLSQEMRATMDNHTARDIASKDRSLQQPTSTRPLSDRERFGPSYDALSDDLKRKIAEARQETLECAFEDPEDDDDSEFEAA